MSKSDKLWKKKEKPKLKFMHEIHKTHNEDEWLTWAHINETGDHKSFDTVVGEMCKESRYRKEIDSIHSVLMIKLQPIKHTHSKCVYKTDTSSDANLLPLSILGNFPNVMKQKSINHTLLLERFNKQK